MTRDDITRMTLEANGRIESFINYDFGEEVALFYLEELERFAALVAAEKEQQMIRDGYRKCAEGQRTTQFCGLLDAAVKAEREACVELCLEHSKLNVDDANVEFSHLASYEFGKQVGAATCATAIRARGER